MSQSNRVSAELSAQEKESISTSIDQLHSALAQVTRFNLSPDERMGMVKMGDKSLAFVEKAIEYAQQNPSLVPPFLDVPEACKDFSLARDLYGIYQQLSTLTRAVEDAMMVAGSDAFDAALVFYNSIKGASRSNVAGTEMIKEDLGKRFPHHRTKSSGQKDK